MSNFKCFCLFSETNNDHVSNTDINKDRLSETENKDSSYKEDRHDVHTNDNIKNVNSENLNRDSNNEHQEHTVQTHEQIGVQNLESHTEADSKTFSQTEEQQFEQDNGEIEQHKQDQQGSDSKAHTNTLDIETIVGDDIGGINTEPVFPDENTEYKMHVETTEPKEEQTESPPTANTPSTVSSSLDELQQGNGDFASDTDENIDTGIHDDVKKSEEQESSSDKESHKNEGFHDMHVQQETEQTEMHHEVDMESHILWNQDIEQDHDVDEIKDPINEDEESQINDEAKQTDSKPHEERVNIPNAEAAQGSDHPTESNENDPNTEKIESNLDNDDTAEKQNVEGHVDSLKDSEADKTAERLELYLQDRLQDIIKEHQNEMIQEIPQEENMKREEIVADLERGNVHVEKHDVRSSELEAGDDVAQEENFKEKETIGGEETQQDMSSESKESVVGTAEHWETNLLGDNPEEYVFVSRQRNEPESSNIPGTRDSEEEKSSEEESVSTEGEDSLNQEERHSDDEDSGENTFESSTENSASSSDGTSPPQVEETKTGRVFFIH